MYQYSIPSSSIVESCSPLTERDFLTQDADDQEMSFLVGELATSLYA